MKQLLTILAVFVLFSCNEDDQSDNPSIIPILEFVEGLNDIAYAADGSTYNDQVILQIINSNQFPANSIIKINITMDHENSTAIEGVDYNFDSGIYTFDSANNFIQTIPIEIISNNSYSPYSKTIVFVANIENTEFKIRESFTINFMCSANLSGDYFVTNDFCLPNGSTNYQCTITQINDGRWYLTVADGWFLNVCTATSGLQNYGNIEVNCSIVEDSDDLALVNDGFPIGNILGGIWDQETGILIMQHTDTHFSGGPYFWTSTYTRQ